MSKMRLFALHATRGFGEQVARWLDKSLCEHQEEKFIDGEQYLRAKKNVRGKHVVVIQSLYSDEEESITEKFTRLLFFIGSLRDASAKSITAVVPYAGFFRQDRKTESRAPITTKYVAQLLEAVGAKRFLTMDVHSPTAMQNAFKKCIPDNLEAVHLLVNAVCEKILEEEEHGGIAPRDFTVVSPDEGGIKRALQGQKLIAQRLGRDIGFAFVDKRHKAGTGTGLISADTIVGNVANRCAITWDDMISSGKTMNLAATLVEGAGGKQWGIAAVHPLCVGKVNENLANVGHIFTTDTIISGRLNADTLKRVTVLSATHLFAQAIYRIKKGKSISSLLERGE